MTTAVLLLAPLPAAQALPVHAPRPGGIAVLDIGGGDTAPAVRFGDRPVLTWRQDGRWLAIVGIPLDHAPGNATLSLGKSPARRITFEIRPADYREQHLTVEPGYVNPGPDALQRIGRERAMLDAALARHTDTPPASLLLEAPLPGRRSDSFGSRRVFNNEPRSPHRGMDLSGDAGTPVLAPLPGAVTLTGDFYFTGNTVILDHGQGLVTLYAHLDTIAVGQGQTVATGTRLGAVGATGRVTGPHLHFATYLNGTPVDPALLLRAP